MVKTSAVAKPLTIKTPPFKLAESTSVMVAAEVSKDAGSFSTTVLALSNVTVGASLAGVTLTAMLCAVLGPPSLSKSLIDKVREVVGLSLLL